MIGLARLNLRLFLYGLCLRLLHSLDRLNYRNGGYYRR